MEATRRPDSAGLAALVEGLRATAERLAGEGPELQRRARAVQVTEKSRDGLVTVTVGARGELIRLDLDPRIYRRPDSRELADTITSAIHRAAAAAQERVLDVFEPLVPRETMALHLTGDTDEVVERTTARMLGRE